MTQTKDTSFKSAYFLHPVYVELQENSPLGITHETFKISETSSDAPMDTKVFYKRHLSKSLPLLMKGYAKDWTLFKDIDRVKIRG